MSSVNEQAVRIVFSQVLGIPDAEITADSSPDTIPAWDSLTHVSLMLAIETECGIQFEPTELMELRSYAAIISRVTADNGR